MVRLQKYTNTLWRSCSPHLEHLTIICRPFYLPTSVIVMAVYIPPQANMDMALTKLTAWTNIQTLSSLWLGTLITQTSDGSCQTSFGMPNMSPVQPEGKTHESLAQSVVPRCFKQSIIIPMPKNNNPSCLNVYRPVALTSLMKVFETLIKSSICSSIPNNIDPLQFAPTGPLRMPFPISYTLLSPTRTVIKATMWGCCS